jgi:hypothetical protein
MTTLRPRLHILVLSDMVRIKRDRKFIELMPFDETGALDVICVLRWRPPVPPNRSSILAARHCRRSRAPSWGEPVTRAQDGGFGSPAAWLNSPDLCR